MRLASTVGDANLMKLAVLDAGGGHPLQPKARGRERVIDWSRAKVEDLDELRRARAR